MFLHSHFKSSESIYMFSDICINNATSQGVSCLHTIFPEALRKIATFLVLFPVLGQEASQQSNSRMIPIESLKSNSIREVTGGWFPVGKYSPLPPPFLISQPCVLTGGRRGLPSVNSALDVALKLIPGFYIYIYFSRK